MERVSYDDSYDTCLETYATLRLYNVAPDEVSRELGIRATRSQQLGAPRGHGTVRLHGWFLSSRGAVQSKDVRRHLDWLLDQLVPRRDVIRALIARGASADISCYWLSANGHGGPTISPSQSRRLGELGIDLWFDFYSAHERRPEDRDG